METTIVIIFALAVLVMSAAGLAVWYRRARIEEPEPASDHVRITLDIDPRGADADRIARIVEEAALSVVAARPSVKRVDVLAKDGRLLGTWPQQQKPRMIDLRDVHGAHVPGTAKPRLGYQAADTSAVEPPKFVPRERPRPRTPLADRLDLTDEIRAEVRDPGDAVEIVRAILETAGLSPAVDEDVIRVGDTALIVIALREGEPVGPDALNHAFFRFGSTGAARGIVVALGHLSIAEARRREALAPKLRYAGPEAIQRMADAVAVGGDPLTFAVAEWTYR